MKEIAIGDIVRLKSGGPNMLVVLEFQDEVFMPNRNGGFLCFWGKEDGLGVACFNPIMLDIIL